MIKNMLLWQNYSDEDMVVRIIPESLQTEIAASSRDV